MSPVSDATVQRLARRIRALRLERDMTLQQVADAASFSRGLLSKIETAVVSPPIATLAKLADALHVPIGEFFESPEVGEGLVYFPKNKRLNFRGRLSSYNYRYELLCPARKRRDMQPMIISVEGKTYKFKLLDHPGEQFILLLSGEMDYVVGDKTYSMKAEDCLYFDARQLHGPKLQKHQKARYLVVFSNH